MKAKPSEASLKAFSTYEVPFPFTRSTDYDAYDSGWRIGTSDERCGDGREVADGVGTLIVEVFAIVEPGGRYGKRAFYTQRWRNPDGAEFESNVTTLRCEGVGALEKKLRGYLRPWILAGRHAGPAAAHERRVRQRPRPGPRTAEARRAGVAMSGLPLSRNERRVKRNRT